MQQLSGYGPKHRLWDDFGDVSGDFWDWWIDHESMFWPKGSLGVWEQETDEDVKRARAEGAFIVSVDPTQTKDRLMFDFEEILREKGITKTGRRSLQRENDESKYPFATRPECRGLKNMFRVYELRTNEPELSLYDIGVRLELNPNALIQRGMTPKQRADKINSMNATVSRYWRNAVSIMEHIGEGQFPVLAGKIKAP